MRWDLSPSALPTWLDPEEADTLGIVLFGFALMVLTLVLAYGVAWYWHRYKDKKASE